MRIFFVCHPAHVQYVPLSLKFCIASDTFLYVQYTVPKVQVRTVHVESQVDIGMCTCKIRFGLDHSHSFALCSLLFYTRNVLVDSLFSVVKAYILSNIQYTMEMTYTETSEGSQPHFVQVLLCPCRLFVQFCERRCARCEFCRRS